ncbi:DHH family phosphoesterase [Streptacidiphilus monticola]|uniref:Bifunctional oligoribonuclease/PAP phosphatase NrnA n=1 Tax=Streptacidiphilus monticola TaxID=2161674 RepID=A0ABW1FZS1_9ACTN
MADAPVLPAPRTEADAWELLVRALRAAGSVDLVAHVVPDGDALGSALAVGLALRSLGTEVRVSFGDDPQVVPASLAFLPGQELIVPAAEVPEQPELMVTFDVADPRRLGLLQHKAEHARMLVVIDHHASNTGFGSLRIIDPAAPATAVLVDELLRRLDVPLDADLAACLYAGLATDTGSFKYAATTPETHELAARLLATGIRHDLISRQLWDSQSFGYLKVLAAALDRAELEPAAAGGQGLVWTWVPWADLAAHAVPPEEIEGLIDVVRKAAEAEVALVLKQDPDGSLRGSCRAKGGVDVARVCARLGGGGHSYAAGFSSRAGVAETVAAFRAALTDNDQPD